MSVMPKGAITDPTSGLSTTWNTSAFINFRLHIINCDLAGSMRSRDEDLHLRNLWNLYRETTPSMTKDERSEARDLLEEARKAVGSPSDAFPAFFDAEEYLQDVLSKRGFRHAVPADAKRALLDDRG